MFTCAKCKEHKFEVPNRVVLQTRDADYLIDGQHVGSGSEIVKEADYCLGCKHAFEMSGTVTKAARVTRTQVTGPENRFSAPEIEGQNWR